MTYLSTHRLAQHCFLERPYPPSVEVDERRCRLHRQNLTLAHSLLLCRVCRTMDNSCLALVGHSAGTRCECKAAALPCGANDICRPCKWLPCCLQVLPKRLEAGQQNPTGHSAYSQEALHFLKGCSWVKDGHLFWSSCLALLSNHVSFRATIRLSGIRAHRSLLPTAG
jgi:hypothetical protein